MRLFSEYIQSEGGREGPVNATLLVASLRLSLVIVRKDSWKFGNINDVPCIIVFLSTLLLLIGLVYRCEVKRHIGVHYNEIVS